MILILLTNSCDVNVLLKRYLCSQAFINVVRGLAQYFRWKQSGRSFTLDKNLIVAHIRDWMLEEVMAIASLSENALENVFQHTMRFDKRWAKFLRSEELSQELKDIQVCTTSEISKGPFTLLHLGLSLKFLVRFSLFDGCERVS